ncbi:MAG: MFS transporter [Cytophagales bacterium]|nr:MFS transporter [Cytophagales bacterium]
MDSVTDKKNLFISSCISLIVTALSFGLRAGFIESWKADFALTNEQTGWITGTAFYGFTLAMIFGGPLCDVIGLKRIIYIAFTGHLAGIVLTIFANDFWTLYISTLFIGIANGMVEASCNPLIATIYSGEKTKMLNRFHMWFPGGIVIGGLLGYFLGQMGISWRMQMLVMLLPTMAYGAMFFRLQFPVTERVASGVSTGDMFKACLSPLFIFMILCMFITASTELGTGQLISTLLGGTGVSPMLVLVFINGIMMVGRTYAGEFVHKVSPAGMLLFSAVFSTIGLFGLSFATGYATFGAALIFAIGVCFFWPTMLSFVAEYLPKTGALGLSLMGGAGMLSVSFVLPVLGSLLDNQSGADTLRGFALLPAALILLFAGLFVYSKKLTPSSHA